MSEATASETLASFVVGEKGRIKGFELPAEPRQRLLEMGLTAGTAFEVIRLRRWVIRSRSRSAAIIFRYANTKPPECWQRGFRRDLR